MPFDLQKYNAPAKRGDVAGVALKAASGVLSMKIAIEKLATGDRDINEEVNQLEEDFKALHKMFDELTGYTKE